MPAKLERRKRIAVTGPAKGGLFAWYACLLSVRIAGAKAVRATTKTDWQNLEFDGLIVGGGADIDPSLYGETLLEGVSQDNESKKSHPVLRRILAILLYLVQRFLATKLLAPADIDQDRDLMELALIHKSVKDRLPVLGICRGSQLLNVYFGGSIHQDIGNFYVESPQVRSVLPLKSIRIEPDSRLFRIFESTRAQVNSLHNQSAKTLGDELLVTATEENGVVQGLEHQHKEIFILGVQWHPEYLPQVSSQRRLFSDFVAAAGRTSTTQGHTLSTVQAEAEVRSKIDLPLAKVFNQPQSDLRWKEGSS